MDFPKDLRYTKDHEWIREEGGTGSVGVSDYAQQRLGDVVYVEMPEEGMNFKKGDVGGVVESVKAASDIFSPASGEVIEINTSLEEHPEFVNQSPYGDGWIFKLKLTDASELKDLMDSEQYQIYVEQEET